MNPPSFQRYQAEFTSHIRDPRANARPKKIAKRGMDTYAEIVFNNMDGTLSACFPVCKQILGPRRWKRLVRDFLTHHRCTTPLFRHIPEELLRWLETEPQAAADLPPFFYSLAHYEWIELAVAVADVAAPMIEIDGDLLTGQPILAPSLALLEYLWPVHRLSPRFKPKEPLAEPIHLLVFRDEDDEVCFTELNPVSTRLIALLQPGNLTGQQALEQIAAEVQHPDPRSIVVFGAALLGSLKEQGAVWGTRSPEHEG